MIVNYKETIKTISTPKIYIGSTSIIFKYKYRNHKTSFRNRSKNDTLRNYRTATYMRSKTNKHY